jgi:hypothetical protein
MLGALGGAHYAVVHITAAHPALPGCWTALAGRGLAGRRSPDGLGADTGASRRNGGRCVSG